MKIGLMVVILWPLVRKRHRKLIVSSSMSLLFEFRQNVLSIFPKMWLLKTPGRCAEWGGMKRCSAIGFSCNVVVILLLSLI